MVDWWEDGDGSVKNYRSIGQVYPKTKSK